jgi:hypothetical protein
MELCHTFWAVFKNVGNEMMKRQNKSFLGFVPPNN